MEVAREKSSWDKRLKYFLAQSQRHVFGNISQYTVRHGALDRHKLFMPTPTQIEPAQLRRRVNLGLFARDLISSDRLVRRVAHLADNIEVKPRRFHHHDVCAFRFVQAQLHERLAPIRWVELVRRLTE